MQIPTMVGSVSQHRISTEIFIEIFIEVSTEACILDSTEACMDSTETNMSHRGLVLLRFLQRAGIGSVS
jgi:hypothetical protein